MCAGRVLKINLDAARQLVTTVLVAAIVLLVAPVRTASAQSGPLPTVTSVTVSGFYVGVPASLTFDAQGETSTSCKWQLNDAGSNGPTGSWTASSSSTSARVAGRPMSG